MAKNEKQSKENDEIERCDMNAARAAFLDFYGDSALSFSNQFLASVFGLVASAAIIQSIFIYLSTEDPLSLELRLVFLLPSLLLFGGLSYMVRYTYKQFGIYSTLANNLASGEDGIRKTANLHKLYLRYDTKKFLSEKSELEKAYEICKSELPKDTPMFHEDRRGEKTTYHVNHIVYVKHLEIKRQKMWW